MMRYFEIFLTHAVPYIPLPFICYYGLPSITSAVSPANLCPPLLLPSIVPKSVLLVFFLGLHKLERTALTAAPANGRACIVMGAKAHKLRSRARVRTWEDAPFRAIIQTVLPLQLECGH